MADPTSSESDRSAGPDQAQPARGGTPLLTAAGIRRPLTEVAEMASLRWQLAELELRSDLQAAKRLGMLSGAGLVAALTGLPVLTIVLAGQLDSLIASNFPWVTLSVGGLLLIGGLLTAWFGWRRFRSEFLGLRESLDECREDLIWLRELVDERAA